MEASSPIRTVERSMESLNITTPSSPSSVSSADSSPRTPAQLSSDEVILSENKQRFVLLPIKHNKVWEMYKKHEASFWTAEEIDLSQDYKDWEKLTDDERHFIKTVLAFFAARYVAIVSEVSW